MRCFMLFAFLVVACAFGLFTYNSNYGYDALEYLVVGRSLLEGYALYDFIPSKSWGLYTLVALFLSLGPFDNHVGVALLVTLLFAIVLLVVYVFVKNSEDRITALFASAILVVSAFFMEMNFLEPEPLVLLCGLGGWKLLGLSCEKRGSSQEERNDSDSENIAQSFEGSLGFLLAGFVFGCGMAFKSVAAFYLVGALLFLAFQRFPWRERLRQAALLIFGFMIALLLPLLYFASTQRFSPHREWTYLFPLLDRPADFYFLPKMLRKLLWFFLFLAFALLYSWKSARGKRIYSCPSTSLALCMGLCALIPLFKQQATHYVFPAAGMLSIPLACVSAFSWERGFGQKKKNLLIAGSVSLLLLLTSAMLYNPKATLRFCMIQDYAREKEVRSFVQKIVPPEARILAFESAPWLYWVSQRYPPLPFVKMDVQESYLSRRNPKMLLHALADPKTVLVEFPQKDTWTYDHHFREEPLAKEMLVEMQSFLQREFLPLPNPYGLSLYQRKQ